MLVGNVVLDMDPGCVSIHEDVVFALLAPCHVLTKKWHRIFAKVWLDMDLECVDP